MSVLFLCSLIFLFLLFSLYIFFKSLGVLCSKSKCTELSFWLCKLRRITTNLFQNSFLEWKYHRNIGNENMDMYVICMCIYIPHISHIVSRQFTILIEWDRASACKGASGCRYQLLFDLTHPPNPCMKCTMKLELDHHTGNYMYVPYSFRLVWGSFNVPCWPCNTEEAGEGAYGL